MNRLPLDGVRVADLTHALSGSFCTQQLHLLGADVVKVEPPVGDDFRERPAVFAAINAGKRSVVLDLKSSSGIKALRALVERSDILVENFRPGVTRNLGIDWDSLRQANPQLIYCSITGYGQTGPLHDYPAIEWAVQAMSGMSASYIDDEVDGAYLGVGVLDPFSGYVAFSAILAALLQRQHTRTGQYIDVSMLDAGMLLMAPQVAALSLGDGPAPGGRSRRPTMVRYRAKDRRLFVGALHRKWFVRLCDIIGTPDLADDPRFTTQRSQADRADELISAIETQLSTRPAAEWEREFVAPGLPASVVRSLQEMLAHPHVAERGTLQQVSAADLGRTINVVGAGFRFEHDQPAFRGGVPHLGEHTHEVLSERHPDGGSTMSPEPDWDPLDSAILDDVQSAMGDLRSRCPVAYTDREGGFYAVSRHADIVAAARDPTTFSSAAGQLMADLRRIPIELDPPAHAAYRRILQPYFSATRLAQLEPRVRHFAADLLQPAIDRGFADLAQEFTFPFPTRVLCATLNIPDEDWTNLKLWAGEVRPELRSAATESAYATPRQSGNDAFLAYARAMVADRRTAPQDPAEDITSGLLAARIDGEPLGEERILGILRLLLSAGHNSTTISLGILIAYLAVNEDLQARLRSHPDLCSKAIEEILRFETPVVANANPRIVTHDVELGGRELKAGDKVVLIWGAGNRDPDAFEEANECVIERSPNRHLVFGHGIHVCVGAPVARQEMRLALEELLGRTQSFTLDGDVVRGEWWRQRGPLRLPVRFQARETTA